MLLIDSCKIETERGFEIVYLFNNGTIRRAMHLSDVDDWRVDPPTDWVTFPPIPQGSPRKGVVLLGLRRSMIVQCDDGSLWQWLFGYTDWYPLSSAPWD